MKKYLIISLIAWIVLVVGSYTLIGLKVKDIPLWVAILIGLLSLNSCIALVVYVVNKNKIL